MRIRLADPKDLSACLELDDSFETEYVWQMDEQAQAGAIHLSFRLTHLPRSMKVSGAVSREDLKHNYHHGGVLFVADEAGIQGFVDVTATKWNRVVHVNNLAVEAPFRRKGIGTRLLRAALEWGRQENMRIAIAGTTTKDYPAICFYQKQGFSYCGFNDQLYPNRDIAIFFALNLH